MANTYYSFQHRVTDPAGETLFVTFQGKDKTPTLQLGNSGKPTDSQLWLFDKNGQGKTMFQTKADHSLQAAVTSDFRKVTVTINGGYVFNVKNHFTGGCSIRVDRNGEGLSWHISRPYAGEEVTLASSEGINGLLEDWIIKQH